VDRNPKANLGIAAAGVLLALSALVGLALALFSVDQLVWPMLLFEPIVLGGGLIALAVGLRLQKASVPMALATAAGCVAIAGFLSTTAGRNTLGSGLLVPLLVGRLVLAAGLGGWAAMLVVGPSRRGWSRIAIGAALLALGGGLAALAFIGPAKPFREWLLSLGGFVASAAALLLFVIFVILVAAGVHLVVRPFEIALDEGDPRNAA
jgi:hypothetical protein